MNRLATSRQDDGLKAPEAGGGPRSNGCEESIGMGPVFTTLLATGMNIKEIAAFLEKNVSHDNVSDWVDGILSADGFNICEKAYLASQCFHGCRKQGFERILKVLERHSVHPWTVLSFCWDRALLGRVAEGFGIATREEINAALPERMRKNERPGISVQKLPKRTQDALVSAGDGGMELVLNLSLSFVNWGGKRLPSNLQVLGTLFLAKCQNLQELPGGLRVRQSLQIQDAPKLEMLPEDMIVHGGFSIHNCKKMKVLRMDRVCPKGQGFMDGIHISRMQALEAIEGPLLAPSGLTISECPELKTLPNGVQAKNFSGDAVCISHCPKLENFGRDWDVGNARVTDCPSLHWIDERFRAVDLIMQGCPNFKHLNDPYTIAGVLIVDNHNNGTSWDGEIGPGSSFGRVFFGDAMGIPMDEYLNRGQQESGGSDA